MGGSVSQPGADVSNDIKRLLGIGQGTLADKEREQAQREKMNARFIGRTNARCVEADFPAPAHQIVTIMDNDDD